jgi:hypothetical protein
MIGLFIASNPSAATFAELDKLTNAWTAKAARGECSWICSSCCTTFPAGMPDECAHGDQGCTAIIKCDKAKGAINA